MMSTMDTDMVWSGVQSVIAALGEIDPRAAKRIQQAARVLGRHRVVAPRADIVISLRRVFGASGIELAGVILRARNNENPQLVARETCARWERHAHWELEARSSMARRAVA